MHADKTLYALLFGESIFNDAVALILFEFIFYNCFFDNDWTINQMIINIYKGLSETSMCKKTIIKKIFH